MNLAVRPPEQAELLKRFAAPAPRYTSYPTAPHFHDGVDAAKYAGWLAAVADGSGISAYIHIPFCDRLCWFCGCHTKHTLKYEPVAQYLEALHAEIRLIGTALGGRAAIRELHLGGGSPSLLKAADMERLRHVLHEAIGFDAQARISVEIDPSDVTQETLDGLRALGMNRASIGVQDFDPAVQKAINRIQTFEDTARVAEQLRACGARSLNIDALYGLPLQTERGVEETLRQVVSMRPDRIAFFGYAHVPWMKRHQQMIDESAIPGIGDRFAQAGAAARYLPQMGYQPIGIDHFALPRDSLSVAAREGRLRRNFQGYTDDACETLIGLGASSIGGMRQGHVQNVSATGRYMAEVLAGRLPVEKGFELSVEDRARGHVIEALMCRFGFSEEELVRLHGDAGRMVAREAAGIAAEDADGFLVHEDGSFTIAEAGRPFTRSIAARFDAYLAAGKARHSTGI
jgi:oxygen-independent coproporphyrinogen-3 oxidase